MMGFLSNACSNQRSILTRVMEVWNARRVFHLLGAKLFLLDSLVVNVATWQNDVRKVYVIAKCHPFPGYPEARRSSHGGGGNSRGGREKGPEVASSHVFQFLGLLSRTIKSCFRLLVRTACYCYCRCVISS